MNKKIAMVSMLALIFPTLAVNLYGTGSSFVYPFLATAAYYYTQANVQYQATDPVPEFPT